ncbi:flippase-like domain-containing protein [Bacteroidia bacterium]|jgi:uncharacterized protein (TIRG00374 family)|nr:flippase-like domain-containing protein [Bacteroidia bacterium]
MAGFQKKHIKTVVFILLSVVLLYLVFRSINDPEKKEQILTGLNNANWFWLFVSIGIAIFSHLFRALRWDIAVEPMGYKIKNSRAFYSVMIGYLVNLATARGGEIARCAIISQTDKIPINVLIGTVLTERLVDLICLIIVILTAFAFQSEILGEFLMDNLINPLLSLGWLGILVFVIGIGGFLFLTWLVSSTKGRALLMKLPMGKKIVDTLNGFVEGLSSIAKLKRPKLYFLYTLGIWVCYWLMTYAVFFCFDFSSDRGPIVGLTALIFASIGMIIPAPGGMGALAVVIAGLTSIYGFSEIDATLISSTSLSANIILIATIGTFSLLMLAIERRKYGLNDKTDNSAA